MRKSTRLGRWDAATVAYLSSRHALGRAYRKEEWILGRLRALPRAPRRARTSIRPCSTTGAVGSVTLSASTRLVYEITVYNFCRYRRRSDPRCFLPDRLELARAQPHPLPTLIEREQIGAATGVCVDGPADDVQRGPSRRCCGSPSCCSTRPVCAVARWHG